MRNFKIISQCRLCNFKKLRKILKFGKIPLGNDFARSISESKRKSTFNLSLNQCRRCGHFQLGEEVNSKKLFATNYTYLTGIAPSFKLHFDKYSKWAIKKCNLKKNQIILDVGSNDGTCLKYFKKRKMRVLGIDPAKKPALIARRNGITTIIKFFNTKNSKKIIEKYGKIDFVTSHNVLAHIGDIQSVFKNIYDILKNEGYFCFEVGYFISVIKNNYFDTLYHEHLDYHHAAPLVKYLNTIGFSVENISVNSIQGGSVRLLCKKHDVIKNSSQTINFLASEARFLVTHKSKIYNWSTHIKSQMNVLETYINSIDLQKFRLYGYGAPTKATLLIRLANLSSKIDFIIEDNKLKTNKYMPKTEIKIVNSKNISNNHDKYIIIFAWNFTKDIIKKLKKLNIKSKIIIPLPKFRILEIK